MTEFLQWKSRRLGEEFVDLESFRRYTGKRYKTTCCECKKGGANWLSISFGSPFCTPGCYLKFLKKCLAWCVGTRDETYGEKDIGDEIVEM